MSVHNYAAIDPMALVLSERAYLIWVELHHPHEPAIGKIDELVKKLSPEEKRLAHAKAQDFIAYGKAIEESLRH